jgi:hypothetical protein
VRRRPDGTEAVEDRPGHEGHAGILHLDQGNKTQRKALRESLASLSRVSKIPT